MWIGVLWAGLRVAMWIIHVGGKCCHGLLEKTEKQNSIRKGCARRIAIISQRRAWPRGKYGCRKVRVYPAGCGEQLGRIPSKNGSSKFLFFLKSFSGEGTLWDSSLLVGVLRGNTIRGNTTRNSERKMALWEGLWEGLCKTAENLWKPSENPLKKTFRLGEGPETPVHGRSGHNFWGFRVKHSCEWWAGSQPKFASCFSPYRAREASRVEIPENGGQITKFLSLVQPPNLGKNCRKVTYIVFSPFGTNVPIFRAFPTRRVPGLCKWETTRKPRNMAMYFVSSAMISPDLFGAQEPRNISTDSKKASNTTVTDRKYCPRRNYDCINSGRADPIISRLCYWN